jgi:hypothetical protein
MRYELNTYSTFQACLSPCYSVLACPYFSRCRCCYCSTAGCQAVCGVITPFTLLPQNGLPCPSAHSMPGISAASTDLNSRRIYSDVCGCGSALTYKHAERANETTRTDVSDRCSSLTVLYWEVRYPRNLSRLKSSQVVLALM